MATLEEILRAMPVTTPEQESGIPEFSLDRVGAAELLGIGGAGRCERRTRHAKFPTPVSELRCGLVWFRSQIALYAAEEARLGSGLARRALKSETPRPRSRARPRTPAGRFALSAARHRRSGFRRRSVGHAETAMTSRSVEAAIGLAGETTPPTGT